MVVMFLLPCWCKETEEKEGVLRKAMPLLRPADISGKKPEKMKYIHTGFPCIQVKQFKRNFQSITTLGHFCLEDN